MSVYPSITLPSLDTGPFRFGNHKRTSSAFTLHSGQLAAVQGAKRFNVYPCGRRFGKTYLGLHRADYFLTRRKPVGWFAATYKVLLDAWTEALRRWSGDIRRKNATEKRIEFKNGAHLDFWTLEDRNAGRSRKYAYAVIDEAAIARHLEEVWTHGIRPTLTDYRGKADFFSTPKGHNYFWHLYRRGLDLKEHDWHAYTAPTTANPYILPEEVEAARLELPERIFQQEYLAEFIADGGGVFRRVLDAATLVPLLGPKRGHRYVFGVDWGKYNDWTVITVVDCTAGALVAFDRFNKIDYTLQVQRLKAMYERWRPDYVKAESNSMGDPVIEQLRRENIRVQPFQTTNKTKGEAIEQLALAFERGTIQIPNDPVLTGELMAYEMDRLPSGTFRYGAPLGQHDDCVMSLAIAWHEGGQTGRSALINA